MSDVGSDSWSEFIGRADRYLRDQQELAKNEFRIGDYERYDYDQATATLTYSHAARPVVVAGIQVVGSISVVTNTWLWAWANDSILPHARSALDEVKQLGDARGFDRLTNAYWPAEEVDGWEMTAASCYLLRGKGAYRSPDDTGFLFMVMTELRWATEQRDV